MWCALFCFPFTYNAMEEIAIAMCLSYVLFHSDNVIEDMTIITASPKAIWKTRVLKDGSLQIDRLFSGQGLVAVFVDEKTNLLYWSDVDASIIFRGLLDGTKREIFMR